MLLVLRTGCRGPGLGRETDALNKAMTTVPMCVENAAPRGGGEAAGRPRLPGRGTREGKELDPFRGTKALGQSGKAEGRMPVARRRGLRVGEHRFSCALRGRTEGFRAGRN